MNRPASAWPLPGLLALLLLPALAWTFLRCADRLTWFLEAAPVLIGLPLVVLTYARWRPSPLLCAVLFVHALVLLHGAQYTYALAPGGEMLRALLGTARNPWDKVGHFLQGVTPALVAREVLLRSGMRRSWLLPVLCIAVALAVSALYELVEWGVAVAAGEGADAFLGTQGDPWDTQSDMLFAWIGSMTALAFLARVQDRQLARTASGRPD